MAARICLNMIVKDEAHCLERCLTSALRSSLAGRSSTPDRPTAPRTSSVIGKVGSRNKDPEVYLRRLERSHERLQANLESFRTRLTDPS
jgi:Rad3-related DNA helicase